MDQSINLGLAMRTCTLPLFNPVVNITAPASHPFGLKTIFAGLQPLSLRLPGGRKLAVTIKCSYSATTCGTEDHSAND